MVFSGMEGEETRLPFAEFLEKPHRTLLIKILWGHLFPERRTGRPVRRSLVPVAASNEDIQRWAEPISALLPSHRLWGTQIHSFLVQKNREMDYLLGEMTFVTPVC